MLHSWQANSLTKFSAATVPGLSQTAKNIPTTTTQGGRTLAKRGFKLYAAALAAIEGICKDPESLNRFILANFGMFSKAKFQALPLGRASGRVLHGSGSCRHLLNHRAQHLHLGPASGCGRAAARQPRGGP